MSWAADRQATRPEDIAYSLFGIFDTNMPLLYGEGKKKAFFRLQEEIMKDSDDHSLFVWAASNNTEETPELFQSRELGHSRHFAFATSPKDSWTWATSFRSFPRKEIRHCYNKQGPSNLFTSRPSAYQIFPKTSDGRGSFRSYRL